MKTLREKEKLLITSNFSFSHSVFYPFGELSAICNKFENCRLQTLLVWKSLKFVVWERVTLSMKTFSKDFVLFVGLCFTDIWAAWVSMGERGIYSSVYENDLQESSMSNWICQSWEVGSPSISVFSFYIISWPEHNMLKVSFRGCPLSVVSRQNLPCGHSRGHISCSIDPNFGQNVCFDEISDEFEFGSSEVNN